MKKAEIYYFTLTDEMPRDDKLAWFKSNPFQKIEFDKIIPDEKGNWINQTDNDFESLTPIFDKNNKTGFINKTVFDICANGLLTGRDEWAYDIDKDNLVKKMDFFHKEYNLEVERWTEYKKEFKYVDKSSDSNPVVDKFLEESPIKWSERLKRDKLRKEKNGVFNQDDISISLYRPFKKIYVCDGYIPIDVRGNLIYVFHNHNTKKYYENIIISITFHNQLKYSSILITSSVFDLCYGGRDSQGLPFYRYDKDGNRHDNITDWALNEFKSHYKTELTKLDIFHYVYAVLHNPAYREKYELNLKREFPRIPYYENFAQWAEWGKKLMELHLNYETVAPFPLERHDTQQAKIPKAKLKADKTSGVIILDDNTSLSGVPLQAWDYKLGNRSALEWILDQYKEKKPKDPTIAEKFNHYRFADYKEQVIDLLMRVCAVSVETVKIVDLLRAESNQYAGN